MSNGVRAQIVGLPEFKGRLSKLRGVAAGALLAKACLAALLPVQNAAKEKVPKLTRTLSRSIHSEIIEERDGYAEAAVGTDVVYAAIHEFGGVITPKRARMLHWVDRQSGEDVFANAVTIPPRPYLRPAWDENEGAMIRELGAALMDMLRSVL